MRGGPMGDARDGLRHCSVMLLRDILGPMADWIDFTGKVVLVTGSSRGIGAGLVTAFDKAGRGAW